MMESYLMMLYVTLDQESALKSFFLEHGWTFCKPDLTVITDKLGPAAFHPPIVKPLSETNVEQAVVENTRKRKVNTPLQAPVVKLAKVLSFTPATSVSKKPYAGSPKQSETKQLSAGSPKQFGIKQLWTGLIKEPGTQKLYTGAPQQSQEVSKETRNLSTQETKLGKQSETSVFDESSITEGEDGCSDEVKVEADKLNKDNADDGDNDDSLPDDKDDDDDDYLNDSSHVEPNTSLSVGDLIKDCSNARTQLENQPDENQKLVDLWLERSILKSPTSDDQYKCFLCSQPIKNKSNLKRHLKKHLPTRINCSICNRFFSNCQEKDDHMASKHAEGFKCEKCGVIYKRKSELKTHYLKHNAETESMAPGCFKCPYDFCRKIFFRQSNYKFHLNTHEGNRPFKCSQCEKAFSSAWSKNVHEKGCLHPTEYTCMICNRGFKQKSGLYNHTQAEHVKLEEGYTCQICLSVFKYSTGLSRHMKEKHQTLDVGQQTEVINDEELESTTKTEAMLLAAKSLVQTTSMDLDVQNNTSTRTVKDGQAVPTDEYKSHTVAIDSMNSRLIRASEVVIESGKIYELDIDSNVVSEMVIGADEIVEAGVDIGLHR